MSEGQISPEVAKFIDQQLEAQAGEEVDSFLLLAPETQAAVNDFLHAR